MSPRLEDLSPADQVAVRAALHGGKVRQRERPSRRDVPGSTPYRCRADGETFPTFTAAERHARASHDGARLEMVAA
ncbi:MAG: hypothetical protein LC798_03225 [Chloroflexi bacterium]|nr:hypothetical protein [Chloroflexota bacterium]